MKANTSQSVFAWNHLGLFPSHSCSRSLPSHWSSCKFMVQMITPDSLHLTPKGTRHLCRCFCLKHSSSPRGVEINLHLPQCLSFPLCTVNQSFAVLLINITSVPAHSVEDDFGGVHQISLFMHPHWKQPLCSYLLKFIALAKKEELGFCSLFSIVDSLTQQTKHSPSPSQPATSGRSSQSLSPQNNPLLPLQMMATHATSPVLSVLGTTNTHLPSLLGKPLLIFSRQKSEIPWDLHRYLLKVWCCSCLNYTGSSWLKEKIHRYSGSCCLFSKYQFYSRPKHKQNMTVCLRKSWIV